MKVRMPKLSLLVLPALLVATAGPTSQAGASAAAPQVHVRGNKLVDAGGGTVVLHGVDRAGADYECVEGNGIFAGPTGQASVNAMKRWDINAVRLPLNEACWNGESYVDPAYAGANYRNAIKAYVSLLNSNGIVVILDLQWSDGVDPGSTNCVSAEAICEKLMPDAAESVPFWSSVARTFKGNDAVLFDLFNEPYPARVLPTEDAAQTTSPPLMGRRLPVPPAVPRKGSH